MPHPELFCTKCGERLSDVTWHGPAWIIDGKTQQLEGEARTWNGNCPIHGRQIVQRFGNHSTFHRPFFRDQFTKAERARLERLLDPADRRFFRRAVQGFVIPDQQQIDAWFVLVRPYHFTKIWSGGAQAPFARRKYRRFVLPRPICYT